MKNVWWILFLSIVLIISCEDKEGKWEHQPLPEAMLMFDPYDIEMPAEGSEVTVDVYLAITDTTSLSMDELERCLEWRIESVSFQEVDYPSQLIEPRIELDAPMDTIRGESFTVIREEDGSKLRCVLAPNEGKKRVLEIGTTAQGVYSGGCRFIQAGKAD